MNYFRLSHEIKRDFQKRFVNSIIHYEKSILIESRKIDDLSDVFINFKKHQIVYLFLVAMVAKRLVYPESEKYNKYDLESPLRPFPNQVGGHAALFQLNKNFVCKPMNEAESDFYSKQMPLELKDKWTANFCCEIEVCYCITEDFESKLFSVKTQ